MSAGAAYRHFTSHEDLTFAVGGVALSDMARAIERRQAEVREANDLAIKLAHAHTGRAGVVSAVGGYHGHTGLAMAAGDPEYRNPFGPNLPGFEQVPFNDLDALDRAVDDTTAAVHYLRFRLTPGQVGEFDRGPVRIVLTSSSCENPQRFGQEK